MLSLSLPPNFVVLSLRLGNAKCARALVVFGIEFCTFWSCQGQLWMGDVPNEEVDQVFPGGKVWRLLFKVLNETLIDCWSRTCTRSGVSIGCTETLRYARFVLRQGQGRPLALSLLGKHRTQSEVTQVYNKVENVSDAAGTVDGSDAD